VWTDEATVLYGSVAVGAESNVYTLAPASGTVSLVALDAYHPTVSPNGQMVAYAKWPGIWLADATGTHARVLLTTDATGLAWSPDGTQLAFSTYTEVDVTDLHGVAHRVFGPASNPQVFAWSPDAQWLAYTSADGPTPGIWIVHPDGTGNRFFVPYALRLAWSPDGSRIAYTADGSLFVGDAAGNRAVAIPGRFVQSCLSWPAQGGGILAAESVPSSYGEGLLSRLVELAPDGSAKAALMDGAAIVSEAG
jgi:Tol biopolymer transport system component